MQAPHSPKTVWFVAILAAMSGIYGMYGWLQQSEPAWESSTSWTPEARTLFKREVVERGRSKLRPEILDQLADCQLLKVVEAFPGGPDDFVQTGEEKVAAISWQAGAECGRAIMEQALTSKGKAWGADSRAAYEMACEIMHGDSARAFCACMAAEAPRHFGTPAVFWAVERTRVERRPENDRELYENVLAPCRSLLRPK